MEIKPAFDSALTGIQRGMQGLDRAAAQVASAGSAEKGPEAKPLVDAKVSQLDIEANVKVLKAADETLGSLLDEKA